MPLSEHEERILAEIERQLEHDDPRFLARTRRAVDHANVGRRRWGAGVLFVLGILMLGGLTMSIVFGLVGFALMFAGLVLGASTLATGETRSTPAKDHESG